MQERIHLTGAEGFGVQIGQINRFILQAFHKDEDFLVNFIKRMLDPGQILRIILNSFCNYFLQSFRQEPTTVILSGFHLQLAAVSGKHTHFPDQIQCKGVNRGNWHLIHLSRHNQIFPFACQQI